MEAYKSFVTNLVGRINPGAKDDMTEDEWKEAWQEFWSKASAAEKESPSK